MSIATSDNHVAGGRHQTNEPYEARVTTNTSGTVVTAYRYRRAWNTRSNQQDVGYSDPRPKNFGARNPANLDSGCVFLALKYCVTMIAAIFH